MCRRIECPQCKKPSYTGCGMHIEQVLGDVPREDRCSCREKAARETTTKQRAPEESAANRSILRRLFGLGR